jgi:hypothetical protein
MSRFGRTDVLISNDVGLYIRAMLAPLNCISSFFTTISYLLPDHHIMNFNCRSSYLPSSFCPPPPLPFAPRPFPRPSSPPFPSRPFPSSTPSPFPLGPEPERQAAAPVWNDSGFGDADSRYHHVPPPGPPPRQPSQWCYDQQRYEQQQQHRQPPPTHGPRMMDPRYECDPRFNPVYAQSYPLGPAQYDPFSCPPRSIPDSRQYDGPGTFSSDPESQSYEYRGTTDYPRPPNYGFTSWGPPETWQWETHGRQHVYPPHDPYYGPRVPGPEWNEDRPRDRRSRPKPEKPRHEDVLKVLNLLTRVRNSFFRKRGARRGQTWPPQRTNRHIPRASPRTPPWLSEHYYSRERLDRQSRAYEEDEDEDYDLDDESWWSDAMFDKRDRNKKGKNVNKRDKRRDFYVGMPEELMYELHLKPKGKAWVPNENWRGHRNRDKNFRKGARDRYDAGYGEKHRYRSGRARWDTQRWWHSRAWTRGGGGGRMYCDRRERPRWNERGNGRKGGNKGKNRATSPDGPKCPNPRCPGEGQPMDEDLLGVPFCGFCLRELSSSSSSSDSSAQGSSGGEDESGERAVQFPEAIIRAIEAVARLLMEHWVLVDTTEDEGVPEERDDRGRGYF